MGNLIHSRSGQRWPYTAAMSSEDTAFPAANLRTPEFQHVLAKTVGVGASWFRGDIGSAQAVVGVDLRNVNFTGYSVESSPDASTWTVRATGTITPSVWTLRYQATILFASVSARYWRVVPSSPLAGATQYQCGGMLLLSAADEFSQNFGRLEWDVFQRRTDLEDIGQGNVEAPVGVRMRIGKEHWHRAIGSSLIYLQRIRLVGAGTTLLYENNGSTAESYLCRLVAASPFTINHKTVGAEMLFEERL